MWDCRYASASQLFVFLLSFAFFPFGPRAIRYYSSTRTTAAVQTSNSLESEEYSLFAVRSIHTLCRLHGPFSADVYMYSTRKHLHVQPFLFLLLWSVFVSRMRSPLMVLVSYIDFLFTNGFCSLVCFLHTSTSTAVWIRLGFSFQIRRPRLYIRPISYCWPHALIRVDFLFRYGGLACIPRPPSLLLVACARPHHCIP